MFFHAVQVYFPLSFLTLPFLTFPSTQDFLVAICNCYRVNQYRLTPQLSPLYTRVRTYSLAQRNNLIKGITQWQQNFMDWRRGSLFLLRLKKVSHKFGNIKIAEAEASPEKPAMSSSLLLFNCTQLLSSYSITGWYLGTIFFTIGCSNLICSKNYSAQTLYRRKCYKILTLVS